MTTLFVLIVIQLVGIMVSITISWFLFLVNKKRTFISRKRFLKNNSEEQSWPWLIDYFQEHPHSCLKNDFPDLYNLAKASRRYQELNHLKEKGKISDKKYEKELNKILPLINIKSDLELHI